jgi:hypothetical protein
VQHAGLQLCARLLPLRVLQALEGEEGVHAVPAGKCHRSAGSARGVGCSGAEGLPPKRYDTGTGGTPQPLAVL